MEEIKINETVLLTNEEKQIEIPFWFLFLWKKISFVAYY